MGKIKASTEKKHIKSVPTDFEERKRAYNEMKELRSMLKERKEAHVADVRKKRKQIQENHKRKEENQLKSGTYQVIKNPEKIRKWKVKARKQLRQIPKDIFYSKYYNKEQ